MGYALMGLAHATGTRLWNEVADRVKAGNRLMRDERGQGTVEYVALILLVAVVLAGVVAATKKTNLGSGDIGKAIMEKIKDAMDGVSK